jgi:predicted PurR-regulated permease PerM
MHAIYKAVLLAAFLVILGLLFRQLVTLMVAVLMTVIVATALTSWTDFLERRGVPRAIGALLGILLAVGTLAGILALVIPPFIHDTNKFVNDVPGIVDSLRNKVHHITGASSSQIGHRVQTFFQRYTNHPEKLIGPITSIGLSIVGVVAALIVMLITAFYIAVRPQPLINGALRLFPPAERGRVLYVMGRLRGAWMGWLQGVAVHILIAGVFIYIGLSIIGIDFAIVFAVLTGLLVVIPYFGAIASAIPPALFALTDSSGKALLVLALYIGVHQLEGNVIIPLVYARAVKLHPALIAVGVVIIGELLGIVGLLVAVPILSLFVIGTEEIWVKPMEEADRRRRRAELESLAPPEAELAAAGGPAPPLGELDDRDHRSGEDADDDHDLHRDPEAGDRVQRSGPTTSR